MHFWKKKTLLILELLRRGSVTLPKSTPERLNWLALPSPIDQTPAHSPNPPLSPHTPVSQNKVSTRKKCLKLNSFNCSSTFPRVPLWHEN